MSTVVDIVKAVGYRLGLTINANSDPSMTEVVQWLNEDIKWLLGICAEERSDLGRDITTITTIKATITAITQANPGEVTATAHGLATGDYVLIKSVAGMTEVNDTWFTVTVLDANTFTIGVNTTTYTAYTSGGFAYKAKYTDLSSYIYAPCEMVDESGILHAGWIKKATSRAPLKLKTESASTDYNPIEVAEPDKYYLDESNNVIFLQTPDAAYTIEIPYWKIQTERSTAHPITAITQANPGQITTDAYAFAASDSVYIENVVGMTEVNGNTYTLTVVSLANGTYTIGVNTSTYAAYVSGGHVTLATTAANYTMPFNGLFDNLLIQSVVMKAQSKDEYDISFELKWFEFISGKAKSLIQMRKGRSMEAT